MPVSDVGINLSCGDGGVAEDFLDRAQISAICQKVSGHSVSHGVRGNVSRNPCHESILFYEPLDGAGSQRFIVLE